MAHAAALDNLAANLARCGLRLSDICSEKLTGSFNAKQLEAVLSPVDSPKFRRCCGWIIDRINALIGSPRAVAVNTLHDLPFSKDLFSFLSDKSFLGWSTPAGASKEGPTSLRTFDFRLAVLMFLVAGMSMSLSFCCSLPCR